MLRIDASREKFGYNPKFESVKPCPEWVSSIDLVLYINLDSRPDRREQIIKEFQMMGIPARKVIRIRALPTGFTGCTKSHQQCISFAMIHRCERVLICEDDFQLHNVSFEDNMNRAMKVRGWNVFMVGMTPIRIVPTSETNIVFVKQALGMGSYVVNKSYFLKMWKIFQTALDTKQPHDMVTQLHQSADTWLGFYPPIVRQRPGWSDIEKRNVDYHNLELGGVMLRR